MSLDVPYWGAHGGRLKARNGSPSLLATGSQPDRGSGGSGWARKVLFRVGPMQRRFRRHRALSRPSRRQRRIRSPGLRLANLSCSVLCCHHGQRRVRKLLTERLPTNSDFDAFCIGIMFQAHRRFTDGMDRLARINMLLALHGSDALAAFGRYSSISEQQRVFYVTQQLSPRFKGRQHILQELRKQAIDKGWQHFGD